MKITLKQARETLPAQISDLAIQLAKAASTNKIGFRHTKTLYFAEDSTYHALVNGEIVSVQCGGEWNGVKANDPINKETLIPVGAYIIERFYFMGRFSVSVLHNNGIEQIKAG